MRRPTIVERIQGRFKPLLCPFVHYLLRPPGSQQSQHKAHGKTVAQARLLVYLPSLTRGTGRRARRTEGMKIGGQKPREKSLQDKLGKRSPRTWE